MAEKVIYDSRTPDVPEYVVTAIYEAMKSSDAVGIEQVVTFD
jgi:hypothetical protein